MSKPRSGRQVQLAATKHGWAGRFEAMGSPCEVLTDGGTKREAQSMVSIVAQEAWRIEDRFSRYLDGSVVRRINTANGRSVEVDDETAGLIDFAATLFDISAGRFDITSGVLRNAWTFDGSDNIPQQEAIDAVMQRVGWQNATWRESRLTLLPGMEIDFGGIGKEYAVDRCVGLVKDNGNLAAMVNFGGDLAVTGPPRKRKAWKIGIEGATPEAAERLLDLKHGALATSGDARRYLERDGIRYGHILDPMTGWPVPETPSSITVAADTCTQAGMLSTLSMLQGKGAEAFLEEQGVLYWSRR